MEALKCKHKAVQNAAHHIAMDYVHPQTGYNSLYHVHPYPSPVRLQHAFQSTNQSTGSPKMFHPKGIQKGYCDSRSYGTPNDSPILGRALCLTPRGSPLPGRVSHLSDRFQDSLSLTSDTDALVAKISAMFPTVSETHIKILLKKYYNREAVVISALQVEKHPITTPGPLSMSPTVARLQKGAVGVYSALQLAKAGSASNHSAHFTPLTGSPNGSPSLLRPSSGASSYYGTAKSIDGYASRTPHSPKMKLKYLKSLFPKAEETLILDVLANKDNNVQKAGEELQSMGFPKKDPVVNKTPPKKAKEKDTPLPPKKVVTIMKTAEEKEALKVNLQKKFSCIAERVVALAVESVDYNEERAEQILSAVMQDDHAQKNRPASRNDEKPSQRIVPCETKTCAAPSVSWSLPERPGPSLEHTGVMRASVRRIKNWTEHLKPILKTSTNLESSYKSRYSIPSSGPNPQMRQGPKDSILLEDYMTWNGPNPELRSGQAVKFEGPEPRDSWTGSSLAKGPNANMKNGPAGLAKGSIYQKLTKKSTKMFFR